MSSKPDPAFFNIVERDGLRLITPKHEVGNAAWTRETVKYRSRLETLDGVTVSAGFGKFFNLDCGPDDLRVSTEDVIKAIERRDAVATLKLDGSLLIRSGREGKLHIRTRGSFGYEFLPNADEMDIFRQKYPNLFDPKKLPVVSLLFEWTTPRNTIVLKYPEPELTLIGAVLPGTLNYLKMRSLEVLAGHIGCPVVKYFNLDKDGWDDLQRELATNSELEGWVIRINDEQELVKIKCQPYLTKHALKSTLTTEKLADMWFQLGQPDYRQFKDKFIESFDEETFLWAHGAISALFDGARELNTIVSHMTHKAVERSGFSRKDAALAGLAEYGQTKRFSAYMGIWEGSGVKPELLKSILLQSTKQVELGMFSHGQSTGE